MEVDKAVFQRALDAEVAAIQERLLQQLAQPLWLGAYGRTAWPARFVLFPRIEAARLRWLRAREWWRSHVTAAIEVLRHGEQECDCW